MNYKLLFLSLFMYVNLINCMHEANAPVEELYHARIEDIEPKEVAEQWYSKQLGKKVKIIDSKGYLGSDSGGEDLIVPVE